ncbi:MAG TPA: prepilin-type N-terminal cleavage/methylation domain-containing protein [Candidatus Paceibacterota bacterium]
MKSFSERRGFTLIELLVVIAIIGILASIIAVSLSSARAKGRDAKRISDIRSMQLALEEYYNDNSSYPVSLFALAPTYISSIPKDPGDNSTSYAYYALGQKQGIVALCSAALPAVAYHIGVGLEDGTNPALLQDANQSATWSIGGTPLGVCNSTVGWSNGFNGKGPVTTSGSLVSCMTGGDVSSPPPSQCYDQTN